MMQIKVRAWDNVANEMHYAGEDVDLIFILGSEGIECTDIREMTSNGEGVHSMDHLIYMQYTNLKDKNGVAIYSGDIIHSYEINDYREQEFTSVVEFQESSFLVKDSEDCEWPLVVYHDQENVVSSIHEIEVIGNIYEHPHLLTGGESNAS